MATYRGHRVEDLLPTLLLFALFITNSILVTCQLPPETAEAIARTINATGNYATVNNKAQNGPIPLSDFRRCSESPLLGVGPEASGAVWVPTTGTLWVLGGGQAPALYEFSPPPELKPLRSIPLVPQIVDPEGCLHEHTNSHHGDHDSMTDGAMHAAWPLNGTDAWFAVPTLHGWTWGAVTSAYRAPSQPQLLFRHANNPHMM